MAELFRGPPPTQFVVPPPKLPLFTPLYFLICPWAIALETDPLKLLFPLYIVIIMFII